MNRIESNRIESNRIESNRIMKMPFVLLTSTSSSSSVFISVLTIIILSILLLVLCEAVTTTTTTTITTTSDYDSSSSSSSSSRIQHHIVNNNNNPNPIINIAPAPPPLKFIRQDFADSNNNNFGQVSTTGVSVFDINNDGYNDILYSAGRHSIDQSYVIINLGPVYDIDIDIDIDNNSEGKKKFLRYKFSNPLSIGPRNGYFQIDVMNGKAFHGGIIEEENHHTGVLLVGGNCVITKKEKKEGKSLCPYDGYNTPSILLDVNIVSGTGTGTGTGCSVVPYNNSNTNMNSTSTSTESKFEYECQLDWKIIWTDIYPRKFVGGDSGDRNGAFVKSLTSVEDEHEQPPAIVLQGVDGIKIYEAMKHQKLNKHGNGTTSETYYYYYYYYEYGNTTTYHIPTTKIAKKKQHRNKDGNNSNRNQKHYYKNINRFTGLAHGYVGTEPGFVSGPRTGVRIRSVCTMNGLFVCLSCQVSSSSSFKSSYNTLICFLIFF
jgi:hypothetical protein